MMRADQLLATLREEESRYQEAFRGALTSQSGYAMDNAQQTKEKRDKIVAELAKELGQIGDSSAVVPLLKAVYWLPYWAPEWRTAKHKPTDAAIFDAILKLGTADPQRLLRPLREARSLHLSDESQCALLEAVAEVGDPLFVDSLINYMNDRKFASRALEGLRRIFDRNTEELTTEQLRRFTLLRRVVQDEYDPSNSSEFIVMKQKKVDSAGLVKAAESELSRRSGTIL